MTWFDIARTQKWKQVVKAATAPVPHTIFQEILQLNTFPPRRINSTPKSNKSRHHHVLQRIS